MADDFVKTAEQMMNDAEKLQRDGAHRNACYLAGYVVECTLKAMLSVAGTAPEWIHDLKSLDEALAGLSVTGLHGVSRYGDPSRLAPTMFQRSHEWVRKRKGPPKWEERCHWDPGHRYDGTRWANDVMSRAYIDEARQFVQIINQMRIDGVVL